MTQKERELLIKDLCMRLPYGVKVEYKNKIFDIAYISARYCELKLDNYLYNYNIDVGEVKPYLFPLSSMTEEQKKECNFADDLDSDILDAALCTNHYHRTGVPTVTYNLVDWCNKNHFNYRGLIQMGLANDATGLNIY